MLSSSSSSSMIATARQPALPASGRRHRHAQRGSAASLAVRATAAPEKEAQATASHGADVGQLAGLNKFSSRITQPKSQGASQAMLYATGLREEDMDKPQ
eukprot:scaffold192128_cov38-Prasinocladus_malaysianus.AAC.1